ncbi:MAG: PD40 domain-containing protein [Pyrinomonadaceae bacterium]|nr:PD40 domain-containing protein [Pyrinomonadaceae bacterium]
MTQKIVCLSALALLLGFTSVYAQKATSYLTEPSLSPDRREVAFVSGGDVWTVSAEGGTAQLLVSHPATESRPLFSPDGKRLAFVSNRTGGGDIYIFNLETSDLRRLTFDDALDGLDSWSRDGNWIYYSSTSKDIAGMNDIFRVSAGGGTPMQVSADRYTNEFWSSPLADGSILFSARGISNGQWWRKGKSHIDETEIWMKSGERYEQMSPRGAKQLWVSTTADGSKMFYVSDRSGAQNVWSQSRGGQPKQLTNFTDGRVLWANLSNDGREIVFERNFRIWKMSSDGGAKAGEIPITLRGTAANPLTERVNLSTQIRELALSPDGKKVAVVSRGEVFAASAKDGGEAVRITRSVAPESFVSWSPDSRKLVYSSERDGAMAIYQYDFASESETQITKSASSDALPIYSPDGKYIAFVRNARAMFVYDVEKKQERELCKIYADAPPLLSDESVVWSPDSRWIGFLTYAPENRSFTNASVVAVNGGSGARPVSFLANSNGGSISWSPDGSYILFDTSQRTETGSLARIDLKLRTPKFREDQFRDLFKQENPKDKQPPAPTTSPTPTTPPPPIVSPSPQTSPAPQITAPSDLVDTKKDDSKQTEIVFDDIRKRLSFIRTGVDVGSQAISPDGKTLLVLASAEDQFNLYTINLDELATDASARQITSTANVKSNAQFSPDSKEVYYIENNRVNIVNLDKREVRPLNLTLEMNVNFAEEKMEIFKQGWRYMRDNFYDEKFHGADWNAVYATYEPLIAGARTNDELRRLMNLMVGELNASHLGVSGASVFTPTPIGKLGLRFDRNEYETNGRLKITEIITLSPAAIAQNTNVGDYLLSVDGVKIDGKTNLDELLENKVNKRVELEISSSSDGSNKREIIVKPISTGAEKNLLYRQWVEANRAYVGRISGGKIGYVHLPDMSSNSLSQLYVDLDAENQAKEGVVVDIRNNNGGFINVYVIDVLSRRGYLTMKERGLWNVPARSALGQRSLERPTVLVTNQHSLSDAEDLTEGYRTLKLGKVVGEPTAGWIIYTWNANLFDGTTFRLPRQLVLGSDGKNMELNPRQVDVPVTRPIGETLTGKDSQLDRAVRELTGN